MRLISQMILFILIFLPAYAQAADKLIFAADLIRHGDRTPISFMPAYKDFWKEGSGQLTARGMQQEYVLGAKLRNRYITEAHLLPENYRHDTIYVRSTDVERTLMSAEAFLMGLYPEGTGPHTRDTGSPGLPEAYQPIPIHTAPVQMDNVILGNVDTETKRYLYDKYVYSTPEWIAQEKSLKPSFERWTKLTGIRIKNLSDVESLGDTLYIHGVHHAPIPEQLTDDEINTIIQAGNWAFMASKRPRPIGQAYSHQLLSYIMKKIDKAVTKSSPLKYVLFSAHDSTIASTLSALGAPLDVSPPYSSDLNFSVYQHGNEYYVRVTYNDIPVSIPECHGTVCTLQQFAQAARAGKDS